MDNKEKKEKFGFFKKLLTAIAKPKDYYRFTQVSFLRIIGFVLLLNVFVTVVGSLPNILRYYYGDNSFYSFAKNIEFDCHIEENELVMAQEIDFDNGTMKFHTDSTREFYTVEEIKNDYADDKNSYFLSKTNMIYKTDEVVEYTYEDMDLKNASRDDILAYIKQVIKFNIIFIMMQMFVTYLGNFVFTVIIVCIAAYILQMIKKTNLLISQIIKLAIYANVPFTLVLTILHAFGLNIGYSFIFGILFASIYVYIAFISMIKMGFDPIEADREFKDAKLSKMYGKFGKGGKGKTAGNGEKGEKQVTPFAQFRNYKSNPDEDDE